MNTNQLDQDESANIGGEEESRPDDPAVVAAAAGKVTPEHDTKPARQYQPSQPHNRGPPSGDGDDLAGDLLIGAAKIRAFLVLLGMPEDIDIYYLKRSGNLPIGNTAGDSGKLIASKARLKRHLDKLARGSTAA